MMPHRLLDEDCEKVGPFSNGTEYEVWKGKNCDKCSKYESESILIELAGCPLAFCLDVGTITGWVSRKVVERIGVPEGVDCITVDCREKTTNNQNSFSENSICNILNKKKPDDLGLFENLD